MTLARLTLWTVTALTLGAVFGLIASTGLAACLALAAGAALYLTLDHRSHR